MGQTVSGTNGDDTLRGVGGDTVSGGSGRDTLIVQDVRSVAFDPMDPASGTVTFIDDSTLFFTSLEDFLFEGGRDGVVDGTAASDVIGAGFVDAGGDAIDGNDALLPGEAGNDDIVLAGGGDDTVFSGVGDDDIFGGTGADVLHGEDGDDLIDSGDQDDTLFGGGGADTLKGGAGNDSLLGVDGDDLLDGGAGNDDLVGSTGNDTLYGGAGADTLRGDEDADALFGGDDADALYGGRGDVIDGGEGGDDNDTLFVSDVRTIRYDRDNDENGTVLFTDGTSVAFSNIEQVIFNGGPDGLIWGDETDELIDATYVDRNGDRVDAGDAVYAGAQPDDDDIFANGGNDTVRSGLGVDNVYGGTGRDLIETGVGNDYAQGDEDNDTLYGEAGNDFLRGDSGDDSVYGGIGNDTVYGGANNDEVYAGDGDDSAYGGFGNDFVYGGDGNDTITGSDGDDQVFGGRGDDYLQGSTGADTLDGGEGADTLFGEDDADVLRGGAGDEIDGGEGGDDHDTLIVARGSTVTYEELQPENGVVTFADGGTLSFRNIETVVIPCFTPGTMIQTDRGEVPVESIVAGNRVLTRDRGYQVIRWVGRRQLTKADLDAAPHLLPVRIARGALGPDMPLRDMFVSPQHRLLAQGPRTKLLFGESEVLVPALHLVGYPGITRAEVGPTDYIHIMCDRHEVIWSDGIWTESFQPGDLTLAGLDAAQRFELDEIFPNLQQQAVGFAAARRTLRRHEADLLLS